jgi:hypothetical protein
MICDICEESWKQKPEAPYIQRRTSFFKSSHNSEAIWLYCYQTFLTHHHIIAVHSSSVAGSYGAYLKLYFLITRWVPLISAT